MKLAFLTDVGKKRAHNEDNVYCSMLKQGAAVAIVCDGMGGANAGEVASKIAIDSIAKSVQETYDDGVTDDFIKYSLHLNLYEANDSILSTAKSDKKYQGMGTTVVMALVSRNMAHIAHVGDSRAYLIYRGEIKRLTRDHSLLEQLLLSGEISEDEAHLFPNKNIITRALGVESFVDIDYTESAMKSGAKLLLCSDGLTGKLTDETILSTVKSNDINVACKKLIDLANEAGGDDNISVALIHNN